MATGRLKLCLASRPEPLLVRALGRHPHLRLEDFNKSDLERYAREMIIIPPDYYIRVDGKVWLGRQCFIEGCPPSSEDLARHLAEMLVDRAEGIFLWLSLTANTVVEALHLNESIRDLIHRIYRMPQDLGQLFAEMWARNNGDSVHHKSRARLYLQLLRKTMDKRSATVNLGIETNFTQFNIMLASSPHLLDRLIDARSPDTISPQELFEACWRSKDDVLARCAGLIIWQPVNCQSRTSEYLSWDLIMPRHGNQYQILQPFLQSPAYSLIHHSARDFLLESEEGQSILASSMPSTSAIMLLLWKAEVACERLFYRADNSRMDDSRGPHYIGPQRTLRYQLQRLSRATSQIGGNGISDSLRAVYYRCEAPPAAAGHQLRKSDQSSTLLRTSGPPRERRQYSHRTHFCSRLRSFPQVCPCGDTSCPSLGHATCVWIPLSQLFHYVCTHPWHKEAGAGDLKDKLLRDLLSRDVKVAVPISTRYRRNSRHSSRYTAIWVVRTPLVALLTTAWE